MANLWMVNHGNMCHGKFSTWQKSDIYHGKGKIFSLTQQFYGLAEQ